MRRTQLAFRALGRMWWRGSGHSGGHALLAPTRCDGRRAGGMELKAGTVISGDGRTITWLEGGDPGGYPVIGLHGTPGCRLSRWPDDSVYAEAGVRYITTDRAGYGMSDRHEGRRVADEAQDINAVAARWGLAASRSSEARGASPASKIANAVVNDDRPARSSRNAGARRTATLKLGWRSWRLS